MPASNEKVVAEAGVPGVKYAVACVADQTIVYLTSPEGAETVSHGDARLWADVTEASNAAIKLAVEQALFLKNGGHPDHPLNYTDKEIVERIVYWVEAVHDEKEFRERPNTW